MARSIPIYCPINETCLDDACTITRCRKQEKIKIDDFARRAAQAHLEWINAKDRREAGRRALRDLLVEQNGERRAKGIRLIPVPRAGEREELIDRILASERQAERIDQHLADIAAERAGTKPRRVRRAPQDLKF